MSGRRVLISGASIAGPALAHWLHEYRMTAVVVERHDGIRPGGQTVDLRGAGRIVARRMGIEDAVRAASTGEAGVAFVDARDRVKAAIAAEAFGGEGFVAELEILRGELAGLLYDRTREHTEYVFGDRILAVVDGEDEVRVSFAHGADQSFDLVVAADGIGSTTRGLVFGTEARVVPLGLYTSYLTIPRAASDGSWARWHNARGGRVVALRPDNLGTTQALMSFLCPPRGYERLPAGEQKELLRRVFADVGWEAPRVLHELDGADEFYCELVGQVRAPRGAGAGSPCSATPATAPRPSAAWAPAWLWSERTCWPASWPRTPRTATRCGHTSGSCALMWPEPSTCRHSRRESPTRAAASGSSTPCWPQPRSLPCSASPGECCHHPPTDSSCRTTAARERPGRSGAPA
ncbi:FAD-dependent monooxygenase [Catellatospora tritici]|uniref:FAD-dependent monooxygenase n=1 Tax=Catellatospora tritici TaxID=2851566 RepID=UPI001C2CC726|nr:FAD-dependent monooxygenase [Catellatospora tritici]